MNNLIDCRDRTAEFFATVQQIQKAQHALHGAAGGQTAQFNHSAPAGLRTSGSNFHSEFDERPDEALLGGRGTSSSTSFLATNSAPPKQQQSQFTTAAQHIGRSIFMVTERLEKLGKCQCNAQ